MPQGFFFSLQSKLIGAFVLVTLAALAVAGSIFVVLQRGDEERQELDRVIAASPAIYTEFSFLQRRGAPPSVLAEFVVAAGEEHDVRILLINRSTGSIAADSTGALTGEELRLPSEFDVTLDRRNPFRPYVSWHPEDAASHLVAVSVLPSRLAPDFPPRNAEQFWPVLAVSEETVARAWLGLLPGLGIAAAIALPVAVMLGILFAQYITRPLQQLTRASQQMARGTFDVQINVDRGDEVGRLARAFSGMASRVGDAHTQMRTLVANVSHDLKTPLTSILGFGQALRDGTAADEAEVRRMGGVIYEEAQRLTGRLNDLLFLSELESGQALLQRDEIDLRRLVEGAAQRIEADARGRGITLSLDLGDGVTASADGAKLERAVENLMDNARKYAPQGSEVRVRTYVEPGAPGHACIEVSNPAPDLTPEELPRLFERFYRHDRTRGEAGSSAAGSGLGLPIARDLVELHGGTLEAVLDGGRIAFTIRLPAGPQGQEQTPPAS